MKGKDVIYMTPYPIIYMTPYPIIYMTPYPIIYMTPCGKDIVYMTSFSFPHPHAPSHTLLPTLSLWNTLHGLGVAIVVSLNPKP